MRTHTRYIDPGIKLSVEQFSHWAQQNLQLDPLKNGVWVTIYKYYTL